MPQSIAIAVVGYGLIGRRHAAIIQQLPELELCAVVEASPEARQDAAALGVPVYEDLEAMLAEVTPQGAVVATPTPGHPAQCLTLIGAGVPTLVEKPIAVTSIEAANITVAARQADVPLLVGHHRRYNGMVRAAKQVIESGAIGELRAVQSTCWFYKPDYYFDVAPWRTKHGAGPISVNLVHDVDLLRYFCGEVESVQAVSAPSRRGFENEDLAMAILRFAGGAIATISVSDSIVAPWSWEMTSRENPAYPATQESCYLIGGSEGGLSLPDLRLRGLPGERIHLVQLVDTAGDSTERPEDLLPGQGDLNLAALVRLLARSGYSGPWCLTRNTDPDASPSATPTRPQSAARDGYRALVALLDDVARTAPDFARPQPMLPDRVYPRGLEFIEFATDEAARGLLVQQLEALCFRLERRHVSKAVELWRQGGVNIVINTEPAQRPPSDAHKSRPRVSEIGLRVSDSRQTVKRAAMLGAPVHESIVAEGELELPAVKGVGGSIVHFIDEQSDLHRVWDIEFNPVTKTRATQPCGLRRIDHLSQTMPLDEMQSWLTYYTSTFEMEKTALTGVADPYGPILSQALSSPAGEVRLNLNGAAAQRTFADSFLEQGMTAGVQHIAFATDDIFETAERLQQTGLERLHIDSGYYTALQQHFGLDSAALARLQQHSILYDRDGEGEYFQLYCRPIFNGFFFEIVERRGGYPGYGARNASVRLAAQVEQQSQTKGQRGQATP